MLVKIGKFSIAKFFLPVETVYSKDKTIFAKNIFLFAFFGKKLRYETLMILQKYRRWRQNGVKDLSKNIYIQLLMGRMNYIHSVFQKNDIGI